MSLPHLVLFMVAAVVGSSTAEIEQNDAAKKLVVLVDDREALTYQYSEQFALPHYWPLHSPSGKLLTVQRPDPYPHHRSLWIADKVQAKDGPAVDFYHCWRNQRNPEDPSAGFRHFIRHQRFSKLEAEGTTARVDAQLQWIIDNSPVLDEQRELRLVALGDGEYFCDLTWRLTPSSGDVKFLSDSVHYAWPYVRMHPQFSGDQGGVITNDRGQQGQAGTHNATANWIDFSNSIDGETEGLALLVYPDEAGPRRWLTREYGTFGPRRAEKFSGKKFTLNSGDSLHGRVGILIHRGDVKSGKIAKRYRQYIEGEL